MTKGILTQNALMAWRDRSCKQKCLDIIDFSSPLTEEEINDRLTKDTTLGQLGISSTKCDRIVRPLINRKFRIPAGKSRLPRGSIKTTTKVSSLLKNLCPKDS